MNLFRSLAGTVCVEIVSASPADMLTAVNAAGIILTDVLSKSDISVVATVSRMDYGKLRKLTESRGDTVKIRKRQGLFWSIYALRKRPILLIGMAIYLFFALYLPTRVLFVVVEGNQSVQTQAIIDTAEKIGISFGSSRRAVRSERIKNALLAKMPQLQWAGVNTYGCVAVISVQERTQNVQINDDKAVRSIVARSDGVIRQITVTKGNALCKVGQAVKKGQVLVSGYTDCGITIKATAAEAEVYAQTFRQLEAVSPAEKQQRTEIIGRESRYSVIFGKKLIKLCKDSGISDAGCVKMYQEYQLKLPGGFKLPVALVREELVYYDTEYVSLSKETVCSWMEDQACDYLKKLMIAGQILHSRVSTALSGDAICLLGKYSCLEMIGQVYNEEIYKSDG